MREEAWIVDLDGVVWIGEEPVAGGGRAIETLRDAGVRPVFFTNNSYPTKTTFLERLGKCGIDAASDEVLTSADAAAELCEPGETVLVVGGAGLFEALETRGCDVVDAHASEGAQREVDALVIGIDRQFDYETLRRAQNAILSGARFVATNDDPTFPTPSGLVPGAGSLVAAVATSVGAAPEIAGKPNAASVALIRASVGTISLVVGDRGSTDGRLALALGAPFAMVRSGVTPEGQDVEVPTKYDAADLGSLVEVVLRDDAVGAGAK